jgi:hypothetical protein
MPTMLATFRALLAAASVMGMSACGNIKITPPHTDEPPCLGRCGPGGPR